MRILVISIHTVLFLFVSATTYSREPYNYILPSPTESILRGLELYDAIQSRSATIERQDQQSSDVTGGSTNSTTSPQKEFEAGFVEGYKAVMGDMVIVPICPRAPICPIGSTYFREGLKAGIRAAER